MRLVNYCPNLSMETTFINTKNSQINESQKFVLNLSQTLDLRSSNKHVALQNLSNYYLQKNIRQHYKNNKLRIIAPTWDYEFELPDGCYSVNSRLYQICHKKHESLTTSSPIHVQTGLPLGINHKKS